MSRQGDVTSSDFVELNLNLYISLSYWSYPHDGVVRRCYLQIHRINTLLGRRSPFASPIGNPRSIAITTATIAAADTHSCIRSSASLAIRAATSCRASPFPPWDIYTYGGAPEGCCLMYIQERCNKRSCSRISGSVKTIPSGIRKQTKRRIAGFSGQRGSPPKAPAILPQYPTRDMDRRPLNVAFFYDIRHPLSVLDARKNTK